MLKKAFLLFFCTFITFELMAQTRVNGYVTDKETGERLIGANVYEESLTHGTVTNQFGYFSLRLPDKDSLTLHVSYVGYQHGKARMDPGRKGTITIALLPGTRLDEVKVYAGQEGATINTAKLSRKEIQLLPSLVGQPDLMKAHQMMPGVTAGSEGSNSLHVRGGSPDQNLVLLDDVPLYYVNHVGGFVSVFDENAVKDARLLKGGFPARYGGRLSSVMDVRMKDGNMKNFGGEINLGIVSSKFFLEGPVQKNKTSFTFTARRSMMDLAMRPISYYTLDKSGFITYPFYDFNMKVNHIFSPTDRIFISGYTGRDKVLTKMESSTGTGDLASYTREEEDNTIYNITTRMQNDWGNSMGSIRWNHLFSDELFSNLTAAYTQYAFNSLNSMVKTNTVMDEIAENLEDLYQAKIQDGILKLDLDWYPSPSHTIKTGGKVVMHRFHPGMNERHYHVDTMALTDSLSQIVGYLDGQDTTYGVAPFNALEYAMYLQDKIEIGNLTVIPGLRFSSYHYRTNSHPSLQARVRATYQLTPVTSITGSYSMMAQYMHMLTSSDAGMPTDSWVPSMEGLPPENAWQTVFGVSREFKKAKLSFTMEGYYKEMEGLITFKPGESLSEVAKNWKEKVITNGRGISYGLEALLKKSHGKFTGWLGYTWSKTRRSFPGVDNGLPFPYKYDRRHDVSLVANYKFNKNISLSASWVYYSGSWVSMGSAKYPLLMFHSSNSRQAAYPLESPHYGDEDNRYRHNIMAYMWDDALILGRKNNYQLPDYHRLNLSAKFQKEKKRGTHTWTIGVYNAYNQMNPYYVYYEVKNQERALYKFVLFPLIPSVSWSFRF